MNAAVTGHMVSCPCTCISFFCHIFTDCLWSFIVMAADFLHPLLFFVVLSTCDYFWFFYNQPTISSVLPSFHLPFSSVSLSAWSSDFIKFSPLSSHYNLYTTICHCLIFNHLIVFIYFFYKCSFG